MPGRMIQLVRLRDLRKALAREARDVQGLRDTDFVKGIRQGLTLARVACHKLSVYELHHETAGKLLLKSQNKETI